MGWSAVQAMEVILSKEICHIGTPPNWGWCVAIWVTKLRIVLGSARNRGLSIIELLVVLAIVGILAGIGVTQLNSAGTATSQASQVVASAINQARFEAVRTNNTAGFEVIAADANQSGTMRICRNVNEAQALSCATGTIVQTIVLSEGDLGRARIASPATLAVFFDRRGVVRNPASSGQVITITDRGGGNIRTVTILPTGRAEVR